MCQLDKGNGELTSSDQETAGILNNYFASVIQRENGQELPNFPERQFYNTLDHVVINRESFAKAIKRVKPEKA